MSLELEPAPPRALTLEREPLVVCVTALVVLVISHYEGSTGWFDANLRPHLSMLPSDVLGVLNHAWWFTTSIVLFALVPAGVARATGAPELSELGIGLGDWRFGLELSGALLLVMAPVVYLVSRTGPFLAMYPMSRDALRSWHLFIGYELVYVAYFAAWEFLFRGWMLFGLAPRVGPTLAIGLQTIPFALMHLGKPELECYGSVIAGLALGALAWRTRSFWYGPLIHAGVAVLMDVLAGSHQLGVLYRH